MFFSQQEEEKKKEAEEMEREAPSKPKAAKEEDTGESFNTRDGTRNKRLRNSIKTGNSTLFCTDRFSKRK